MTISMRHYQYRTWELERDANDCTTGEVIQTSAGARFDPPAGNFAFLHMTPISGRNAEAGYTLSVDTPGTFGMPQALALVPDGTEVLEARAEIHAAGLTRTKHYHLARSENCAGDTLLPEQAPPDDVTLQNISYSILGLHSEGYDVIGSVPGAVEGTRVVDFTQIAQAMLAQRSLGTYGAYALAFLPEEWPAGSIPGPPTIRVNDWTGCRACAAGHFFAETASVMLQWDNASIGTVLLKLKYPEAEYTRELIQPRWPVMA